MKSTIFEQSWSVWCGGLEAPSFPYSFIHPFETHLQYLTGVQFVDLSNVDRCTVFTCMFNIYINFIYINNLIYYFLALLLFHHMLSKEGNLPSTLSLTQILNVTCGNILYNTTHIGHHHYCSISPTVCFYEHSVKIQSGSFFFAH